MTQTNKVSKNNLPAELLAANAEIEKLAYTIKFTELPKGKRPELMNRLTERILSVKGLDSFVELSDKTLGHSLTESRSYSNYSGLVYANMIKDVLNAYGMTDKKTGKIIPFMQLFNKLLKLRENTITKEKCEEKDFANVKAREARMRALVKNVVDNTTAKAPNMLNADNIVAFLQSNNCAPESIAEAKNILANSYVSSDMLASEKDSETIVRQSDFTSVVNHEASENAIRAIVDGIEAALKNTSSPTVRDYILYHANLKFFSYVPTVGETCHASLLQYYIPDLLCFAAKLNTDDEAIVLSKYLHIAEESASKNVKKAKKALALVA